MVGQTSYFDTPVVPNTAFAEGYNHPDCDYPDATPAIKQVNATVVRTVGQRGWSYLHHHRAGRPGGE